MTEEEKTDEQAGGAEKAPKKGKKPLFLGGGIVGLVASAYIVSMVALPGDEKALPFTGPFIIELTPENVQVNLKGNNGQRYLVMRLQAKYTAYDEIYTQTRFANLVYQAEMVNLLISHGRQKTMTDVEDEAGEEIFFSEVLEAAGPLLFPIHVGNEDNYLEPHKGSGIRPGHSIEESTMRGGFKAHVIKINDLKGEISLDDGPVREFDRTESDFMLETQNGLTVFVDLTELKSEYVGEVNVGCFGHVQQILTSKFLFQ